MNSQHRHGGTPELDLARLNLPVRRVLDFSVNLNALGSPAIIRQKWPELYLAIENYPGIHGDGVAQYYDVKFGIPSRNLLAGNGSTEMIYLVPRVFRFGRVLVVTPSYHDYERASILAGTKVTRFPLLPGNKFSLPNVDELIGALKVSDALWLGRPNNPTGTLLPKEILLELAGAFPDKMFIIDEAFIQFSDKWEESSLLCEEPKPNILIIHSLTKFYALAGLRLGGVVGSGEAISRLRQAKEPWTVNGMAEKIAPLLIECADYEHETRSLVAKEYKKIFQEVEALNGITPFPSPVNFLLCQWHKTGSLDDLIRHLLLGGAYVRDCRNFPGLEEGFFRVGLRAPWENDQLLSLLSSF
ncbi:MAG: pyridoxal phosphate-dependent class II aminotransferase [Deltaproteobacteria bacterium]|nr:pyridoxal phosphate-dependent class II aminotransferase [Deltaproteobacteria bacterium]